MTTYYSHGTAPAFNAPGSSAQIRAELDSIAAGFTTVNTEMITKPSKAGDIYSGNHNFTGANITVPTPVANQNPTSKQYVDTAVGSAAPVAAWVSGATYTTGMVVFSPINFQSYRHITATSSLTVDPANDVVNWIALTVSLVSPNFTGIPTAPTAAAGTSTTQLATTAFATTADNLKANLDSPAFTGTPTGPTAAAGTNTTQLATTAFATATVFPGFFKLDSSTVAFAKTAAGTISIKAGTKVIMVAGVAVIIAVDTAVVMPALTAGTDYAIYACTDGTVRADASFTAPTGYTTANSRMIGGFHYGLTAPGTAVGIATGFSNISTVTRSGTTTTSSAVITGLASTSDLHKGMTVTGTGIGVSAVITSVDSASQVTLSVVSTASATVSLIFTNTGMIWTQADVDLIAGINAFSLWDLKWRPLCDPKGMALVAGRTWVDIYFCGTNHTTNGTSKAGTDIASGTVLPKKPLEFGGNGTVTYATPKWGDFIEIAAAYKKRLLREQEFILAAFGVTENQSIDSTAATYPTTQRNAGYTSKYGLEQASGHHWIWGDDSSAYQDVTGAASYKDINGGRGQVYTFGTYGLVRVILGGTRAVGVNSGSRCSNWGNYQGGVSWSVGLRAAADHLMVP